MKTEITNYKKSNGVNVFTLWSWNKYDKSDKIILCCANSIEKINDYEIKNNLKCSYLYDHQKDIKTILQMIKEKEEEKKKKKTKKQLHAEIEILWKYIDCKDVDLVCNELEKINK